jgi:tetratricopeptide (TPR) repeat protein
LRDTFNNSLWARDWFVGLAARTFGDHDAARTAFSSAREVEAKIVAEQPDYAPAWSRLGLIDAALGRKAEAIAEGLRACELLPVSKDTLDGPSYVTNLAMIYAWVGEKDLACEQLAASAKMPVGVTYGELKLSPQWDALRGYRASRRSSPHWRRRPNEPGATKCARPAATLCPRAQAGAASDPPDK